MNIHIALRIIFRISERKMKHVAGITTTEDLLSHTNANDIRVRSTKVTAHWAACVYVCICVFGCLNTACLQKNRPLSKHYQDKPYAVVSNMLDGHIQSG